MSEQQKHAPYLALEEGQSREAQEAFPDEETLYNLADLFKLFSDSTRIRILYALSVSQMCVADLATLLQLSQPAVSHQLRVLRGGRLVTGRREGKMVFYSLADAHVRSILSQGLDHVME